LRIDVGLIVLVKLGREKFAAELILHGMQPETMDRALNHPKQRRPLFPEEESVDRRSICTVNTSLRIDVAALVITPNKVYEALTAAVQAGGLDVETRG